jgi:hypothetical protein
MSSKPPAFSTPDDWSGKERRVNTRNVDAVVLDTWARKVDERFGNVEHRLDNQDAVLTRQNTVLEGISSALFAEDDKGQHKQIGLMTTAKRLCGFVLVVKWVAGIVVGGAALVAGFVSIMGVFRG